ncbi:hypothetical protein [Pseudarthrobacter albicanus]|uniref:hypothetical protein n=1 Tax=Pseudarthrobacter albicanus TaxID=2823873 RepID=UPI001BA5FF98|nr:hypothetical protein [Pseudarthrobacter albicanus]
MTTYETSSGSAAPELPPTPDHAPKLKARRLRIPKVGGVNAARFVLGTVLAVLLALTWAGNNPAENAAGGPSDWKSQLSAASLKNELYNGDTKGAPQQSVVNGWYANDIASIEGSQNSYIAASSARNGTLLMLIGIGFAGELVIRGLEGARLIGTKPRPFQRLEGIR